MGTRNTILTVLIVFTLVFISFPQIKVAKAQDSTIYIRADGSVEGTDMIQREVNVYTLTDGINGSIIVERNNVVLDGAGYKLQGNLYQNGITLRNIKNVTINNFTLSSFNIGIVVQGSNDSNIFNNIIVDNFRGIDLTSSENIYIADNYLANNNDGITLENVNNRIFANIITNSSNLGIYLYGAGFNKIQENNITNNELGILVTNCFNNTIHYNNFINNTNDIEADDSIDTNGNYWSNYNGIDNNGDGIGDTLYIIDEINQDNRPLIKSPIIPEFPSWIILPLLMGSIIGILIYRKNCLLNRKRILPEN